MTSGLIPLDFANLEHRQAASELSLTIFPTSPAAILGRDFLCSFYFLDLVRDGAIECLLYRHEGKYIGLAIFTAAPLTFIRTGMRQHFFKLCFLVAKSLLARPRRLASILDVMKQNRWRGNKAARPEMGELLTFGVLEEYREVCEPETQLRISKFIFRQSMKRLREMGCSAAQLVFLKTNGRAQTFFTREGGTLDPSGYCTTTSEVMVFDLGKPNSNLSPQ